MTIACRACDVRVEALDRLLQPGDVGVRGEDLDLGAVEDELAHRVHQLVEALGVDADGGGAVVRTRW